MARIEDARPYRYQYRPAGTHERRGGAAIKILLSLAMTLFVAGSVCSGLVFVSRTTNLFVPVASPPLPLPPILGGNGNGAPLATKPGETTPDRLPANQEPAPDWRNKQRVNVLLLGIDERPDQRGDPVRTDTMMVVTIDPYSHTAGMLGIPRDLLVPIPMPGHQTEDRVNTAHFWGDVYTYPGGGPALAKRTIQYNLGVPIHYYARINFSGFEKIVDTLGGITVDVPAAIRDDEYPTDDYRTISIYIPAGRQQMNGKVALQYARTRHQDSDFGRMKRQQQVLLAIRDKALQLNVLPRLPQLALQFKDTVSTDMSIGDLLALAQIGKEIDRERIVSREIEGDAVTPTVTAAGADILIPQRKAMEKLVSEVFFDSRLREDGATVEVLNGTTVAGLATRTADFLKRRGLGQVSAETAPGGQAYPATQIVDTSGKPYTAAVLADLLRVPRSKIQTKQGGARGSADIQVLLGKGFQPVD